MNRKYSRVAALAIFLCLSLSPVAMAASQRERDVLVGPGERVVRFVKRVKNLFRGLTTHDDSLYPPIPKP